MARVLGMAFLFLFLWRFFWMVHTALFLALLAILIAIILHVPAKLLSRWIPFRVAFAIVLLLFVGGLVGLLVAIIPQLLEQGTSLASSLPQSLESLAEWFRRKTGAPPDPELREKIQRQLGQFAARFLPAAFNAITTVLGSTAIVVLAAFLAAEPGLYVKQVLALVPEDKRPRWERLFDEAGRNLRAWVIGKAFTMLGIGVATYLGLTLLGVPGALALAAFAALMEFIPNFGPTIAAIPAIIAAFAVSPATAVYVAAFYFLLQQVQNAITVPLVERRAVNIPPGALLIWQLMLAIGFGLLALFVATPLLAVLVVAVR
ncbi:MAG TPA: AI-2E family transporter, partial [Longimicrobiaceae bacterium]|nr:AI-2E family transporter [Longimicrobiaceae bacterium]